VLLASKPNALSAVGRIFIHEVRRWQKGLALFNGLDPSGGGQRVECGAISFPQRFGGSLNLNVHYHVIVPDAVFVLQSNDGPLRIVPHGAASRDELEEIVHNTACRVLEWLWRKGYVRKGADDEEPRTERRGRRRSATFFRLENALR
jgi:Putative transposase